jgi:pyruvate,water dikinase
MAKSLFIWLGSGRSRKRKINEQGCRLDSAAQAGLPVSPGAVILDEFLRLCLEEGLAQIRGGLVFFPDPELFHNTLFYSVRLPRFKRPVVVHPLLPADDGIWLPGRAESRTSIADFNDAGETATALSAAWSAALNQPAARGDVLVMEEIEAKQSGIAITDSSCREDHIRVNGVDGSESPEMVLPRLRSWRSPDVDTPSFVRRVQLLLGGVRRTFGDSDWGIEWADDGRICWLVRLTPLRSSLPPNIDRAGD